MVYLVVTTFLLQFDQIHWAIDTISVFNYNLYFLIFLVSFSIFRNLKHNKFVFLNISFWALIYSLSILNIFLGNEYLFGNDYLIYSIFQYRKFLISLVTCLTVAYLTIEYLYYKDKTYLKYLKVLAIVLPVNIAFYYNFLFYPRYIFKDPNHFTELYRCMLETNFLSLFLLGLYGFLLYRKEKPIIHHINLMVAALFFFIVYDAVDSYVLYFLNTELPILSNIILTVLLLIFLVFLLKNLKHTFSEFGEFYDRLTFSEINLNLKITKKKKSYSNLIIRFQQYLSIFSNRFFFIALMIISCTLFILFFPKGYGKRVIFAFMITGGIFIVYLNALFNKQKNNQYF